LTGLRSGCKNVGTALGFGVRAGKGGAMNDRILSLDLEVEELEKGRKPGGCYTSSSTSPLCTCPCRYDTTLGKSVPTD
jgi:hypothetical protein